MRRLFKYVWGSMNSFNVTFFSEEIDIIAVDSLSESKLAYFTPKWNK